MGFSTDSGTKKIKKLTPKQEKFCQNIVKGSNPAQAYREAYNPPTANNNTIRVEAHDTLKNPNVALRIEELRKKQIEEINYTIKDNFNELDIGAKAAMSEGNFSAYVKAIELKGKLLGFYTEKKEVDVGLKAIQVIFDEKCKGL
ncbi:MAG: terminase small subunit [Methanobrevibacter sp.]|nr:terminase small subunit [Methanobrevibacter sp.]